jgi:hypothetical protein
MASAPLKAIGVAKARSALLGGCVLLLADRDQAPVALDEAAIACRIGGLKSQRRHVRARGQFRPHRRQRRGLDQRNVGIDDENVVVAALDLIARRQNRVGGAPAFTLDGDFRFRRGLQGLGGDAVAFGSDDHRDIAHRALQDG